MKNTLAIILFMALSFSAVAQSATPQDSVPRRFFAGFGISNATYYLRYSESPPLGGRHTPVATAHAGYWLSNRASIQLGLGYGVDRFKHENSFVKEDGHLIHYSYKDQTRAFSAQLTGKYMLTNPARRLQLYGLASLTSVWGTTRSENSSTDNDVTTINHQSTESGMNVFVTGGLGLNYRLNKRFDVYLEAPLYQKNLSGQSFQKNVVLGTGLNFRF